MNNTSIEWVKNPDGSQGYTWNPITGCLNHDGNGNCKGGGFPCYAYRLAHGRLRERYIKNLNTPIDLCQNVPYSEYVRSRIEPFYPRFWEGRLEQPLNRIEQMGIFVCDMSDLFGIGIPEDWTRRVLNLIRYDNSFKCMSPHRFYLLTKQPHNLLKWSPFPDNCWVGVTVCTNGMMTLAMQYLSMIEANIKFISFEPLLGMIGMNDHMNMKGIIDWVIIGAQTKPTVYPKIEWVREIVEAADKAGIPVFLKNKLLPLFIDQPTIPDWAYKGLKLRQELPE